MSEIPPLFSVLFSVLFSSRKKLVFEFYHVRWVLKSPFSRSVDPVAVKVAVDVCFVLVHKAGVRTKLCLGLSCSHSCILR